MRTLTYGVGSVLLIRNSTRQCRASSVARAARRHWSWLVAVALLSGGSGAHATRTPIDVLAASSLTDVLSAIADDYRRIRPDVSVRLSFAASSALARQVDAGAPAAVVALANVEWMDYLESRGRLVDAVRGDWLRNGLVIVAPADSEFDGDLAGVVDVLERDNGRIALGNTAHVPAGIYGQAALRQLGLWSELSRRVVETDNVRATLALVERGEVAFGVVYATDARISDRVREVVRIPADSHPAIVYSFARLSGDAVTVDFYRYVTGAEGRARFREHGFALPSAGPR